MDDFQKATLQSMRDAACNADIGDGRSKKGVDEALELLAVVDDRTQLSVMRALVEHYFQTTPTKDPYGKGHDSPMPLGEYGEVVHGSIYVPQAVIEALCEIRSRFSDAMTALNEGPACESARKGRSLATRLCDLLLGDMNPKTPRWLDISRRK